jgi:hypothetical protein
VAGVVRREHGAQRPLALAINSRGGRVRPGQDERAGAQIGTGLVTAQVSGTYLVPRVFPAPFRNSTQWGGLMAELARLATTKTWKSYLTFRS